MYQVAAAHRAYPLIGCSTEARPLWREGFRPSDNGHFRCARVDARLAYLLPIPPECWLLLAKPGFIMRSMFLNKNKVAMKQHRVPVILCLMRRRHGIGKCFFKICV